MFSVVRPLRWLGSLVTALALCAASVPSAHAEDAKNPAAASKPAKAGKSAKSAKSAKSSQGAKAAKAPKASAAKDAKVAKPAKSKTPAKAKAKAESEPAAPKKPCTTPPVAIDRGGLEAESLALVDCKGRPLPEARVRLSVLARPFGVERPSAPIEALVAAAESIDGGELAPGVRLLDEGLVTRVFLLAHHFRGKPVSLVSGYRPSSKGSLHQGGRALDVRIVGVEDAALAAFCKELPDTGCGYYPNNAFIHLDVRAPSEGTVYWIDAAGPGEAPQYVSSWPTQEVDPTAAAKENEAPELARTDAPAPLAKAAADVPRKRGEGSRAAAKTATPASTVGAQPAKKVPRAKARAEKSKPADKRRAQTP
jgi:hypothetical protein